MLRNNNPDTELHSGKTAGKTSKIPETKIMKDTTTETPSEGPAPVSPTTCNDRPQRQIRLLQRLKDFVIK